MQTNLAGTVWSAPEAELDVIVGATALSDVSRDIVARGKRAAGIFLAPDSTEPVRRIVVEHTVGVGDEGRSGSEPALLGGIEALEDIILMWRESPRFPGPVGFYVAEDVDPSEYCEQHLPQVSKYLKGSVNFLLFLRPEQQIARGTLVVVKNGAVTHSATDIVIDLPVRAEARSFPAPPQSMAAAAAAGFDAQRVVPPRPAASETTSKVHIASGPVAAPPAVRSDRNRAVPIWAIVAGLAVACVAVLFLSGAVPKLIASFSGGRTAERAGTPAEEPSRSLNLQVARRGGDFDIAWDRDAAVIRTAQRGFLYINDGGQRTQVFLEKAHLSSGHVMYVPKSNDLDVRLEVVTPEDRLVRESLRVLQAGSPTTVPGDARGSLGVSAPAANPRQPVAKTPQVVSTPAEEPSTSEQEPRKVFLPPAQQTSSHPAGSARIETVALPENVTGTPELRAAAVPLPTLRPPTPPPQSVTSTPQPSETQSKPLVAALLSTDRLTPVPVRQVPVQVPANIRSMLVGEALIEVTLQVDEAGRVTKAQAARQDSIAKSQLAVFATDAARAWRFDPATRAGKPVPSSYTVVFRFKR